MKELYNFYLDYDLKVSCNAKLNRLIGDTEKGKLSALIRVLLKQFNATPDDKISKLLLESIEAEYTYSALKNKRSRL